MALRAGYLPWHNPSQHHQKAVEKEDWEAAGLHERGLRLLLEDLRAKHAAHHQEQQAAAAASGSASKQKRKKGGAATALPGVPPLRLWHVPGKHYHGELLERVCGELGIEVLAAAQPAAAAQ